HPIAPASSSGELSLVGPGHVSIGDAVTAKLSLQSAGSLSAVSAQLSWDPTVVEPTATAAGAWLLGQGGLALSPLPGGVDAAALAQPVSGKGLLATVSFRVLAAGDPHIQLVRADGRDASNQNVPVSLAQAPGESTTPSVTQLAPAVPNPAAQSMAFAFSLARGGAVDLSVYTVRGRLVKTLVHETRDPGSYQVTWNGVDESGQRLAAGTYYLRLVTPQGQFARTLTLLK